MTTLTKWALTSPHSVALAFVGGDVPEYLHVPGLTRGMIEANIAGFIAFLKEVPRDEQARWQIHVPRDPMFDEPDDGFLRKDDDDKESDRKALFHIRPDTLQLLEKKGVVVSDRWRRWIEDCMYVRELCEMQAFALAQAIDQIMPGMRLTERMLESTSTNPGMYRIGVYEPGGTGYAKEHVDRNFLTMHLGASHPGLYFKTKHGEFPGTDPESGEALAFPSAKLSRLSGGRIPALKHGSKPCATSANRWFAAYFPQIAE